MQNDTICIIDYGMGNIGSIQNIIKKIGGKSIITSDINIIKDASKIILPGVGSFQKAMSNLHKLNLVDILNHKATVEKTPLLGICLGMQLLTKYSEEGNVRGLGWIEAETVRFDIKNKKFKVPHMGWNLIIPKIESHQLSKNLTKESKFYFVHSYYVKCSSETNILFETNYEEKFSSGIIKDNIIGVQFHPEKSHKFGMQLMRNFLQL